VKVGVGIVWRLVLDSTERLNRVATECPSGVGLTCGFLGVPCVGEDAAVR
jgi:hypothetical protein